MFEQFAPGPVVVLQVLGGGLDGVAFHVLDRLVQFVLGEIDAGGAGKVRNTGLGAGIAQVLGVLGLGLLFSARDDHGQAHEHLDRLRVTPRCHGGSAHLVDLGAGGGLVLAADEHALGVAAGKAQAALGAAGLEQYRGALWRWLAQVITLDPVELALMVDLVHFVRPGVDPLLAVVDHRAVFPAAFPELVQHLQVLVGLVIAAVVLGLLIQAHGLGCAVEVAGDDVPAHPATAQVVEGGKAPGEQVRRLVGQVGGQAEAEVAGDGGHG
ncbi:hypothetical protein D3C80_1058650 [compost metagenome]